MAAAATNHPTSDGTQMNTAEKEITERPAGVNGHVPEFKVENLAKTPRALLRGRQA
jgi:hypothetical protein